jgi:hypothetical protein
MKHQIILVDGQSTVGKSTTSKCVYEQIAHKDKIYWLHEECEKHPIRHEEFKAGNIHSLDGMELNRQEMLRKWEQFSEEIKRSKKICITEGCFLHTVDRYLLESAWNEEQIIKYFLQIQEIIKPLNPLIVFLHRPEIKLSFEKAFKARGDWWRDLILGVPEPYGYFKTNEYKGNDSIFAGLAYEQEQMAKIFDVLSGDKIKIDTTDECWDRYVREITETAGYKYYEEENKLSEIEKYCGTYRIQGGEDTWSICFDDETKRIYTSLFWPYMPMKYIGNEQFELISFPVTLQFDIIPEKMQFIDNGNYDWEYNSKRFIRI